MTRVIIEAVDGTELARIEHADVPRSGDHINAADALWIVTSVIWELTDGPLTEVRVIVQSP